MPIYEYRCEKCGVFERTQRIKEAPLKRCPKCKGKVERLMSRTSFVLKGSGWYATDYARSGSSPASTAKPESTSTESSSNGTSAAAGSTAKSEAPSTASPAKSTTKTTY